MLRFSEDLVKSNIRTVSSWTKNNIY